MERNLIINYQSRKDKEIIKRNEKIPDPQKCFGPSAINQTPQIVWGGPLTLVRSNQSPTLRETNFPGFPEDRLMRNPFSAGVICSFENAFIVG